VPLSPLRPLLVASDQGLVDAVLAVAGEARVELAVATDVGAAAQAWASAPVVLLAPDEFASARRRGLPPRPGLVAVARAIDDAAIWRELMELGAEHVVELPEGAPWLYERLGRSLEPEPTADVVVVLGAVGGAGTSTLAAALSHQARSDGGVAVLVDLDPTGAGLDVLLGAEQERGARWDELAGVAGRVDESVLFDALLEVDGVRLLSWPSTGEIEPDAAAVTHVLHALGRRPGAVVVDAGRATDVRSLASIPLATRVVVVVPLRVRAVAAARRLVERLPQQIQPLVVVREPAPGGLSTADVERALGLPVVATLEEDRRCATTEEIGGSAPSSSMWRRVCRQLLDTTPAE
jgi:secretion/DNA translocation related CpaE-like protein